jgi:spoIIIJ-associated protein
VTEAELLEDLLRELSETLDLKATVEIAERDGELYGTLHGDDLGLFIGRHGQTIDAVQHLAQRAVATLVGEQRRVVIDAKGYRGRRQDALERQAEEAAGEALRFGRPVALDAMTAGERRLVHEFLRERGDVDTHSEGEEPERHLVVSPVPAG